MQNFRDVIDECGFMDLGFTGPRFTWTNNRPNDMAWERLDRAMATTEWIMLFPSVCVHHLDGKFSDHKPLWIGTDPIPQHIPRLFRFEEMWTSEQGCEETIAATWRTSKKGVPMFQVWDKIHACRRGLCAWSKHSFGSIKMQIRDTKIKLKQAEVNSMRGFDHHRVTELKRQLRGLMSKEERMWRQRSRTEWLKAGDSNTRFFHCRATQRKRRNHIHRLKNNEGVWTENQDQVPHLFLEYYTNLFTTETPSQIEKVVENIRPVVTPEMNKQLTRDFTSQEVENAMKHMAPLKAPGPDGLPPLFYQKYWHVVVVSESQSAFVPGRLITDNILVAFETLHHMHHQRQGKQGSMALKLDMSKAYDRVEWKFLERVMQQMGFHAKWVTLMMECISTVSYSILINGAPHGFVKPTRELRPKTVTVSKKSSTPMNRLRGKKFNHNKTTIFFSKSTPQSVKQRIQTKLEVPIIKHYEKYLGLPSFIGRAKYTSFAQIKERVWSKLKGWKAKLISQAGREVLIKSVAQAIPSFAMSCFRLPAQLCSEIEVLIRKFWWGANGDKGKMHWIKWRNMCQSKSQGGLGFRELEKFNKALLGKQVWRLLHNTKSLFYKVFKAKFFPSGTIMEAQQTTRGSYAWKSILGARDLIKNGTIWRVGDGSHINIWTDNWLPGDCRHKVISPHPNGTTIAKVSDLIQDSPRTQDGRYSVRSGYRLLMDESLKDDPSCSNSSQLTKIWNSIWSLQVPSKVRHFLWHSCHDSLPTKENLHRRHILDDARCESCKLSVETTLHALWNCPSIELVWSSLPWRASIVGTNFLNFLDLIQFMIANRTSHEFESFAMVCWSLWYHRNKKRLSQPTEPQDRLVAKAQELLAEYNSAHHSQMPPQPSSASSRAEWKPPDLGRCKVNFDGAVFAEREEAGIGVIIRNSNGEPMAALCQRIPYPHSVNAVEASAARAATQLAIDVGILDVEIEGDSAGIVSALLDPNPCLALFGHLIEDTKLLAQSLNFVSFKHVKRDGNSVAHTLAKKAKSSKPLEIWLETVSPDILPILCKDFSLY
uniref:RNase H type-1 domain-containing protein n=1 Tax=Fagus sylvatica TaxID=28930 RepID=A0A2N9F767_FAGSY